MHPEKQENLLRVVVIGDKEGWYAQGFEIDHDAEGDTLSHVKRNFELSLAMLVQVHMELAGNVNALLKATPAETCESLLGPRAPFQRCYLSFAERKELRALPFNGICYMETAAAPLDRPAQGRVH